MLLYQRFDGKFRSRIYTGPPPVAVDTKNFCCVRHVSHFEWVSNNKMNGHSFYYPARKNTIRQTPLHINVFFDRCNARIYRVFPVSFYAITTQIFKESNKSFCTNENIPREINEGRFILRDLSLTCHCYGNSLLLLGWSHPFLAHPCFYNAIHEVKHQYALNIRIRYFLFISNCGIRFTADRVAAD